MSMSPKRDNFILTLTNQNALKYCHVVYSEISRSFQDLPVKIAKVSTNGLASLLCNNSWKGFNLSELVYASYCD